MRYLYALLLLLLFNTVLAQKVIKKSYKDGKVEILEIGDKLRISYPSSKLGLNTGKDLKGISGKIVEIKKSSFVIKSKHQKEIELNIEDVVAIKRSNTLGYVAALVGTYALIGGGVIYAGKEADLNKGTVPLLAAAAIIPSAIVSTGVFFPANPRQKVGKNYTLEIINP